MTKFKAQISNECQMTNAKKYVTGSKFIGSRFKVDELVKSRKTPFFVIPAKAGIQFFQLVTEFLDSGFHRSDDFLRNHQG
jgi:hypothetical protein